MMTGHGYVKALEIKSTRTKFKNIQDRLDNYLKCAGCQGINFRLIRSRLEDGGIRHICIDCDLDNHFYSNQD